MKEIVEPVKLSKYTVTLVAVLIPKNLGQQRRPYFLTFRIGSSSNVFRKLNMDFAVMSKSEPLKMN